MPKNFLLFVHNKLSAFEMKWFFVNKCACDDVVDDESTIKIDIKHFKGIPKKRVLCYLGAAIE